MWQCPGCGREHYIPPGGRTAKCSACGKVYPVHVEPGSMEAISTLTRIAYDALRHGSWDEVKTLSEAILCLDMENPDAFFLLFMETMKVRDISLLDSCNDLFLHREEYRTFAYYGDPDRVEAVEKIGKRNLDKQRKKLMRFRYNIGSTRYQNAETPDQLREAASYFEQSYGYWNSATMHQICLEKAEQMELGLGRKFLKWFLPYGA